MWMFLAAIGIFGAVPNFCRRMEILLLKPNGPRPKEWTMKQDVIASFARPDALEEDIWAKKRERLNLDVWADMRKGGIDADREKTNLYGNPSRRKKILESSHDQETIDRMLFERTADWEEPFEGNSETGLQRR